MKRWPTQSEILSAESQLAHNQLVARERLAQVRSAIRSRMVQPSSLLVVTGLGALLGVWFARRSKPRDKQDGVSVWAPIAGVASTLLIRFAMQHLAERWQRPRNTGPDDEKTTGTRVGKDNDTRTK